MGFSVAGSLSAVVGGILIIVGIVLYCGTGGAYLPFTDYAIAIDVQSQESKVTLYKWDEDKKVAESGNCVARNGIDYKIEKSGAFNHLLYCVQDLASRVNSEHKIPVLLDASTGIKLLDDRNNSSAESILDEIENSLKNLRVNNSQLTFAKPKIISGKGEALDAWIATNYLMQISEPKNKPNVSGETIGILDMGGVSAQIAYEVLSENSNSEANILGKEYFLRSSSNLCYGIHQALNRYYSLLVKDFRPHSLPRNAAETIVTEKPHNSRNYKLPKVEPSEHTEKSPEKAHIEKTTHESNSDEHYTKAPHEEHKQKTKKIKNNMEEHKVHVQKETEKKEEAKFTPEDKTLENAIEKTTTHKPKVFKRELNDDKPDVEADHTVIADPCSNIGVRRKIKGSDLLNEICVNNVDGKPPTDDISADLEYEFVGSNDAAKCREYITKLTSHNECRKNFDKCAVNNITVPTGAAFVAFSNYYKISRAIPELRVSPSISLEKYEAATKSFCSHPWSFIANSSDHLCETNEEECKNYCFGLQFIERTLSDLYNFGIYDWNNVLFINKIHDTHLNWVLGDVLLASNKIPGAKATAPVLPMYGLILMLVAGIILLGYGLANMYTTHSKRSNYESV